MAYRTFSTHPLVVRRAEVRRVVDVSPRMRRVTVGGTELDRSQFVQVPGERGLGHLDAGLGETPGQFSL